MPKAVAQRELKAHAKEPISSSNRCQQALLLDANGAILGQIAVMPRTNDKQNLANPSLRLTNARSTVAWEPSTGKASHDEFMALASQV